MNIKVDIGSETCKSGLVFEGRKAFSQKLGEYKAEHTQGVSTNSTDGTLQVSNWTSSLSMRSRAFGLLFLRLKSYCLSVMCLSEQVDKFQDSYQWFWSPFTQGLGERALRIFKGGLRNVDKISHTLQILLSKS